MAACKKAPSPAPPPPTVRYVRVETHSIERTFQWVATLDGSTNAEIRPRVSGPIEQVAYQEGTVVKEGTLLFTIDKRPFVAALEKARGDHASAVAQLNKSRLDVKRYTPLVAQRALSREQLDNAIAAERQGVGNVEAAKGTLHTAELNLEWCDVRAPITGLAGIAQVRVGNLVTPQSALMTVSTLDPIRGSVNISEREYLTYADILNNINDPRWAATRYLEILLINGQVFPHHAQRVIVNRQIDPTTGTLLLQALFPNPGNILRPGMFAQIRVHTGRPQEVLLVPEVAVSQVQGLFRVSVIDAQNLVQVRTIHIGFQIDHQWVVQDGLSAGERVIVEGLQNAPPGTRVNPVPSQPPQASGAAGGR
jgi:RND family efflux transporter MFP subunit